VADREQHQGFHLGRAAPAGGRLSIHDKLGAWLPQYPAWRDVTIAQLLSMTSGIPDYAGQDAFGEVFVADPTTAFTPGRLVSFVAGLPLGPATYAYSNTNYILAQMIIERATHDSYAAQLSRRILRPLGMRDTCLPLVGSLRDLTTWATALYGGRLLPPAQQRELRSLVSMTTGRPITAISADDPAGFGLGVAQRIDSGTGRPLWMYRGQTFGFQVLHMYVPESGTILTLAVNSAADQDTLTDTPPCRHGKDGLVTRLVLRNALTGLRAWSHLVRWPVRLALGRDPAPDANALIEHQVRAEGGTAGPPSCRPSRTGPLVQWRLEERLGYQPIADRLNLDLTTNPPPTPNTPSRAVGLWTTPTCATSSPTRSTPGTWCGTAAPANPAATGATPSPSGSGRPNPRPVRSPPARDPLQPGYQHRHLPHHPDRPHHHRCQPDCPGRGGHFARRCAATPSAAQTEEYGTCDLRG
jgi:Beta-lactamase